MRFERRDQSERNIPPEEVDTQRKRAFLPSGLGWGLDGFGWTMFAYALPAITVSLGMSVSDGPFVVAFSWWPWLSAARSAARWPTASAVCGC